MGRGRVKGRKFSDNKNDENGSGEEEKIPVQKRRGRPQKPLKDDIDDEVAEKIMEEEDANSGLTNKDKSRPGLESGKKRKKKEKTELLEEENDNDIEVKSSFIESTPTKSNSGGGNRRKGKPCRAAEACIECS